MTAQEFVYWLQGYLELGNPTRLDSTQVEQIKDHLKLVFEKVTPQRTQDQMFKDYQDLLETFRKHHLPYNPHSTMIC